MVKIGQIANNGDKAMNTWTNNFGDQFIEGPMGIAKIIKGTSYDTFKWRVYLFKIGEDQACDWGAEKTLKSCKQIAVNWVSTGKC